MNKYLSALALICIFLVGCYKTDPAVLELLKKIQTQNDALKVQVAAMQKTTDSLALALKANSTTLNAMDKKIDSIRTQLVLVLTQINSLNTQLGQANANIIDIQSKIAELKAKIDELNKMLVLCCGAPASLTNGLVAYYPFNGNANDESGNGNNASINNTLFAKNRLGQEQNSLRINGINSNVSVPECSGFEGGALSISLWVKPYKFSINGIRSDLIGKDGLNRQWVMQLENSGLVRAAIFTNLRQFLFESNKAISLNNWHHLILTWDSSNLSLFIDGNNAGSIMTNGILSIGNDNLTIGSNQYFSNWLESDIDEVRIYNRAITQDEIFYLANH